MKGRLYRTIILILTICTIVSATAPVATANSSATTAVAAANINDTNNESAPTGQDKYNRSKSVPSETTSQPQAENSNTETESQRRSTPSSTKLSEDVKNKLQTVLEEPTTRATISSSEASSPVTVTRGNVPDDYPLNVIIRVKNKSDFGTVHDRIQSLGSIRSTYPNQYLISAEIPANQFDTLTSVSGIDFIDQNGLVAPDSSHTVANTTQAAQPDAHLYPNTDSWGVKQIDADKVHASGLKGSGVNVAVLDTGVARTAGLQDNIIAEEDLEPNSQLDGDDPVDNQGHGSNVAGTIAASNSTVSLPGGGTRRVVGVAPETNLLNAKINSWTDMMDRRGQQPPPDPFGGDIDVTNLQEGNTITEPVNIPDRAGRYLLVEASWTEAQDDIQIELIDQNGNVVGSVSDSVGTRSVQRSTQPTSTQLEVNGTGGLSTGNIDDVRITGQSVSGQTDVDIDIQLYNGGFAFFDTMANAVYWASGTTPQGRIGVPQSPVQTADVISLSYGTGDSINNPITGAMDVAADNGVVFVTSAGNGGGTNVVDESKQKTNIITVGSVNDQGRHSAFFSQIGDTANDIYKPDIVAPGENIPAAGPPNRIPQIPNQFDGTELTGTSMATPHVSGVAALYIQKYRNIHGENPTPQQVRAALIQGSVQPTQAGKSSYNDWPISLNFEDETGAGIVNAYNTHLAFTYAGESNDPATGDSDRESTVTVSTPSVMPSNRLSTGDSGPFVGGTLYHQDQNDNFELSVDGTNGNRFGPINTVNTTASGGQTYTYTLRATNFGGTTDTNEEWALSTLYPPSGQTIDGTQIDAYNFRGPLTLDPNESAAYVVPNGESIPAGTYISRDGGIRAIGYYNSTQGDIDISASVPNGQISVSSDTNTTEYDTEQVVTREPSGTGKVIFSADNTAGSINLSHASNYPLIPLPSEATVDITEDNAGNASKPGQVEFDLKVENGGNPYTYSGFGAPNKSHFSVEIGQREVDNITVTELRKDKYKIRASAPTQSTTGNYNLTIEFTDEKLGVSHTAKTTAKDAIGYSGEGSSGATAVSLIIDRSGSMGGDPIDSAKDASGTFLQQMRDDEYIGVVAYDDTVENISEMKSISNNRSQINNSIYGISAGGSTDIGNGLKRGRQNLDAAPKGTSKAAILLTDGNRNDGPSRSQITNNIVPKYEASGYNVYSVAFGSFDDEPLLKDIANVTDDSGNVSKSPDQRFYSDPDQDEIQQIYQDIRDIVSGASKIQSTTGTVSSNSNEEESVPIDDSVGSATVNINVNSGSGSNSNTVDNTSSTQQSQGGSTETKLYDPNDQLVKKNDSTATGTERSNVKYSKISGSVTYRIDDPQSGDWSYEIVNNQGSAVNYDASVSASTSTTLGIATDAQQYTNGSTARLTATVLGSSGSVSGATVVANITTPDGSKTTIQMAENSPGTYTTDVSLNDVGQYSLTVTAQNGQVSRTKTTQITSFDPGTVAKVKRATQGYNLNTTLGGNISTKLEVTRPSQPQGGSTVGTASNTDSFGSSDKELSDFESAAQELALSSRSEIKNASVSKPLRQAALTIKEERSNQNTSAVVDTNLNAPSAGGGPSGATVYLGTTDFEGPDNDTIPADRITISPRAYTATKGQTRDVTVDIDVPTGIQDGNYTGDVTLTVGGTSVEKALKLNVTEGSVSAYTNRIEQAASNWNTASTSGKEYYEEQIADELTNIYFAAESGGS